MQKTDKENNKKTEIFNLIFVKIIPIILGIICWTNIKNNVIDYIGVMNENNNIGLSNNIIYYLILFTITTSYWGLIKRFFGWKNSIKAIFIISLLPIYIVGSIFKHFPHLIKKTVNELADSSTIFAYSVMSIFFCFMVIKKSGTMLANISLIILPFFSITMIVSLFLLVFFPYKSIFGALHDMERIIKFIYKNVSGILYNKEKSEESAKGKVNNNLIDSFISKMNIARDLLNRFNYNTTTIIMFNFNFLLTVTIVCLNFSCIYYNIYNLDADSLIYTNRSAIGMLDFVVVSIKALFCNDYSNIYWVSNLGLFFTIVESVIGIFLFVNLITSFSMVSSEQSEKFKKDLNYYIDKKIEELNAEKRCEESEQNEKNPKSTDGTVKDETLLENKKENDE